MITRLLALQQPSMQSFMVNFVIDETISERLVGFVVNPEQPTDVGRRPLRSLTEKEQEADAAIDSAAATPGPSSAVVKSYRAASFLAGGFETPFERWVPIWLVGWLAGWSVKPGLTMFVYGFLFVCRLSLSGVGLTAAEPIVLLSLLPCCGLRRFWSRI